MLDPTGPFNVELLNPTAKELQALKPVRRLDIYDGLTTNFHEDGLFSISIFGRVGSEERDRRFSFIDVKTKIIHPVLWQRLVRLKGLYEEICAGRGYAVWNPVTKDFENSNEVDGDTGYHFFLQHWNELTPKPTESPLRDLNIKLFDKYRNKGLLDKVMVLPAGLRDLVIDDNGRTSEDEINKLYRKLLATANTVVMTDSTEEDSRILDIPCYNMQRAFNEIYETLESMLRGKKGHIQSKWGSRRVFNGTRNVITAMNCSTDLVGGRRSIRATDSVVGLYQTAKGALPLMLKWLRDGWIGQIFGEVSEDVYLVNPRTLKRELVRVSVDTHSQWGTREGLEKLLTRFENADIRSKPVRVEGYYLGLIYLGPGVFKIFNDIDELPAGLDRKDVHPLTLCQLLYCAGYTKWDQLRGTVTRYPVTGQGSIYPCTLYIKTTVTGFERAELGDDWAPLGSGFVAPEFPDLNPKAAYHDSLVPHLSRVGGLGADLKRI